MKKIFGFGVAAVLIFAASVGYAQDEHIADAGTFLNDDQIKQVLVGHEFFGEGGGVNDWVESYRSDGNLKSEAGGGYMTGGKWIITGSQICLEYTKRTWKQYNGCYKIRLIAPDGSKIEYVRGAEVTKGTRR